LNAQISLGDLGMVLLGIAFLVLIIYAIILLKNLSDTIKLVQNTLRRNQSNIDGILNEAPSIAKNIESISGDVSQDIQSLQKTFDTITSNAEAAATSFSKNSNFLNWIISGIQIIYSAKELIGTSSIRKRRE
jgi:uncharacterized protein YoxC